ncbi:ligase [Aureococcus anophagefferens]|nr:ligase [Aureococcus anophagefferens]
MPGAPSMKLDALSDLLREARGASRRDALALVAAEDASQTITYGQLDDLCAALGGHLRGACASRRRRRVDRAAARVSLAQVVGTLGAMAARLVAAPLNPTYHVEELEFFIGDAEAKVVVVEAANASAKSAWLAATALGLPTLPMELSWTASGPALTLGAGGGAPAVDLEPALPTDLALVLHTSGTTSRPKLVPLTHKNMCVRPLANAARDFRPGAFASGAVPELRFIRSGSAALPPDFLAKIEASFRAPLIESYGMTEAAQLICANPLPPGDRYAGSVGVCAGPEGRVFNAETGRRAEEDDEGCAGEMCIAGPSVMSGYARNPAANDGAFFADPDDDPTNFKWFRTGDLVSRTKAGYYSIVGRIKEIINRAGEKIAPAKLDKVLAYDGRKDSVVTFGVHCPDFGQAVACAMVFDPDKFADDVLAGPEVTRRAKLLLETALKKLAPHELPTVVYAILKDDVPKTATGKTKRIKCGEVTEATQKPVVDKGVWRSFDDDDGPLPAAATPSDAPPPPPPGDAKEAKARALAAIAEALISVGVPLAVPDDAPFMQSGLTSMMVFAKALGATLDVGNLPHMLVFDAPTPNALASELAGRLGAGGNGHAKLDLTAAAGGEGVAVRVRAASWRLPGEALKPYLADPDAIRLMLDTHAHARSAVPADRWSAATPRTPAHGARALEVARLVPSRRRESDAEPGDHAADVGIFVGLSFHDWALANFWDGKPQSRRSVFASSGSFTSVASGRLSFVLGLQGPCSTINTACSSGLVALQGAHDATAGGDAASGALACGVNVVLEPTISINFAVKGITSPRGRCWTFDASADGYLRSEAAGCFAVAPVDDALDASGFSEDAYCATSLGVSVRHDGKSASLTAPNGSAQHAMIVFALRAKARGAYAFAGRPPRRVRVLAVSGAKNAFGHGEAAAGSVGLLALLIGGVRRGDVACNGALRSANPAVRDGVVDGMGSFLLLGATDAVALNLGKQDACCGVSSLGASGTIAHALLKCVDVASERELPLVADGLASEWPPIRQRESFKWQPYEPPSGANMAAAATVDAGGGLQLVRDAVARFVGEVGDDDDLFDVGGLDSLVAIELLAELQAAVDVDLPQTLIVECPTVNAAGAVVDAALASSAGSRPVAVAAGADDVENTEGDDGPSIIVKKRVAALEAPLREGEQIFFVHGVDGDPLGMLFHSVAASLRFPSSTVRCIEKPKVVAATLEDLAQYYVDRIRERQPQGPYRIFGHSFGALIAHQVALMFEANGQTVAALVLGDFEVTYPPSRSKRAAKNPGDAGRFGVEEWEGGEIESIKLACRRFGSLADGGAFDPDEFRNKVLTNASGPKDRRMRAMYHYMPGYMQRKEWDRLLDLWERNMEYLHTVTVPKFGPKKRETFEPQGMVQGPTLHLRALGSKEFAAAEEINRTYCADYTVAELDGLHYNFLQAPYCDAVARPSTLLAVRRRRAAAARVAAVPDAAVGADDVAFVLFTSGTTGAPKAVAQTHGKILAAADRMFRYEAGGSAAATQGATLAFLPLYHNLGLYHNFVLNLRAGSKTLVHAAAPSMPLTLGLLLEAAPALKPTSLEVVAVLAEQLAQLLAVGGELGNDIKQRLASLDSVKVGGSPLSAEAHVDAAVAYDLRGGGAVGELVLAGLQDEPYATGDIFRRGDDGSLTPTLTACSCWGPARWSTPRPSSARCWPSSPATSCAAASSATAARARCSSSPSSRGGASRPRTRLGVEAALADVQADAPAATRILDTHVLVLDEPLPVTLKGAVDVTAAMDRKKTVLKQADDGVLLDDSLAALKRVCYANE